MNKYICKVCETKFSTNGTAVPPTPSWGDGHVCELVKIEPEQSSVETGHLIISDEARERAFGYMKLKKSWAQGAAVVAWDEEASEHRMKIIAQNGNDGLHYREEDSDG